MPSVRLSALLAAVFATSIVASPVAAQTDRPLTESERLAAAEKRIAELEREAEELRRIVQLLRDQLVKNGGRRAEAVESAVIELAPAAPRGRIGIRMLPVPETLAGQLDLEAGEGVLVADVQQGSAASRYGVRAGDVLVSIDGRKIKYEEVEKHIGKLRAGQSVEMSLRRRVDSGIPVRLTIPVVLDAWEGAAQPKASDPKAGVPARDAVPAVRMVPAPPAFPRNPEGELVTAKGVLLGIGARDDRSRVEVTRIAAEDSNAAIVKLEAGDVVVQVDGQYVTDVPSLQKILSKLEPGATSTITFVRGEGRYDVKIVWGDSTKKSRVTKRAREQRGRASLGIRASGEEGGVRVDSVEEGSSAAAMGLEAGDLIVSANGTKIESVDNVRQVLRSLRYGDAVDLSVRRGDEAMTLSGPVGD